MSAEKAESLLRSLFARVHRDGGGRQDGRTLEDVAAECDGLIAGMLRAEADCAAMRSVFLRATAAFSNGGGLGHIAAEMERALAATDSGKRLLEEHAELIEWKRGVLTQETADSITIGKTTFYRRKS